LKKWPLLVVLALAYVAIVGYTIKGNLNVIGNITSTGGVVTSDSVRIAQVFRASYPGYLQADGPTTQYYAKLDAFQGLTMSMPGLATVRNTQGTLRLNGDAVGVGRSGHPDDVYIDANGKFRTAGACSVGTDMAIRTKSVIHDSLRVDKGIRSNSCIISDSKVLAADTMRTNTALVVGGQAVTKILRGSATLNFDLTSVVSQDLTITVTGAALGNEVFLGVPNGSVTADTIFLAWVSAANTVTVRAARLAGTPNPASGTFNATVIQ